MNMPVDNQDFPKAPGMPDTRNLNFAVPLDETGEAFLRSIMDVDIGPVISGGDREPPIKRVAMQFGVCFRGDESACCGRPGACNFSAGRS